MVRPAIPDPLPLDWPVRRVDSAIITSGWLADGRFRQRVEHAPLPGVTPAMCLWWLGRVDQPLTWRGITALAYRFWHPADHISFTRRGAFGPGMRWYIVEAFGADRRFLLDQTFHVTRLHESGFSMEVRKAGQRIAVVDEDWAPSPAGLIWTVEMTVGSSLPGIRSVTRRMLQRRLGFLERWRQHNVEEAGYLPCFLPELYARETG
jgi:hypothetical protein